MRLLVTFLVSLPILACDAQRDGIGSSDEALQSGRVIKNGDLCKPALEPGKIGQASVDPDGSIWCCVPVGSRTSVCYPCDAQTGCSFPKRELSAPSSELPVMSTSVLWSSGASSPGGLCSSADSCQLADVDGDGRVDAVAFVKSTQSGGAAGDVRVALATFTGFGATSTWSDSMCLGGQTCALADVNGDGKADAVALDGASGDVEVALSTGSSFGPATTWSSAQCPAGRTCAFADVNGDGKADLVAFDGQGSVWVGLSTGSGFAPATQWSAASCTAGQSASSAT